MKKNCKSISENKKSPPPAPLNYVFLHSPLRLQELEKRTR